MELEFDPAKRKATLLERGLDFADAPQIFNDAFATHLDSRRSYGEDRFVTTGMLGSRVAVLVWTWRGSARRIISMRYANEREITGFKRRLATGGRRA